MHNVNHIHSCSYYCDRPECIKEQRDSLVKKLEDTLAQTSKGEEMSDLRKAAQALVDRWDTPLWKDVPHTGVFIDALRAALAEPEPCADEFDCDHMPWCRIRKTCQKQARTALAQPEQLVVGGDDLPTLTKWTPQRKPLTDEKIDELSRTMVKGDRSVNWLCRAIEKAHGIGGEHE